MWKERYQSTLLSLMVIAALAFLLIGLGRRLDLQFDLTEGNRFTLHRSTLRLLEQAREPILVEVFLDGTLPQEFRRLRQSIQEILERYVRVGQGGFEYKFRDPSAGSSRAANRTYAYLVEKGLQPSQVSFEKDGGRFERIIFPGALIHCAGREVGITLLKSQHQAGLETMVNSSIESLEYRISRGIRRAMRSNPVRVGLWRNGWNEADSLQWAGLFESLGADFLLSPLEGNNASLSGYDVVIVAGTSTPFSDHQEFLLDQYMMRGGKLLLMLDGLEVDFENLEGEGALAVPSTSGIERLLFRIGCRVNQDILADASCANIPVVTGTYGNQPAVELIPWPYFPSWHPLSTASDRGEPGCYLFPGRQLYRHGARGRHRQNTAVLFEPSDKSHKRADQNRTQRLE